MSLIVDSREPPSLTRPLLNALGPEAIKQAMIAGDYRIEHNGQVVLIERKAINDLITTWTTPEPDPATLGKSRISRLRRQLRSCQDASDVTALLVEGELEEDPVTGYIQAGRMLRKVKYQAIVRLLMDLQGEGIKLLWTANGAQTVSLILALHESLRRSLTWTQSSTKTGTQSSSPSGLLTPLVA